MLTRNKKGQEALEFILITVLVFFAALAVVLTLGGKLAKFFESDSSAALAAGNSGANVLAYNAEQKYVPDYSTKAQNDNNQTLYEEAQTTAASEPVGQFSVGPVDYTQNSDGSVSFSVAGQDVALNADILGFQETVLETSGSAGVENLVSEVAYLIEKNKSLYPDQDVPVQIAFGTGQRKSVDAYFDGTAQVNTTAIKVGDQMVVIQKDQNCSYASSGVKQGLNSCCSAHNNATGTYRLEGSVDADNNFTANVTSDTPADVTGTYSAKLDISNGLQLTNSTFNADPIAGYGSYKTTYSWNLDFTDSTATFSLTK